MAFKSSASKLDRQAILELFSPRVDPLGSLRRYPLHPAHDTMTRAL